MKKHPPTTAHNYLKKVLEMNIGSGPDQVTHVKVFHDDWCNIRLGGFCNCDPDIQVDRPEPYLRVVH